METTFDYLRQFGPLLAERILETYPPLQSTKDPVAPSLGMLLRQALPAQALAITGTAKYLRRAKAARILQSYKHKILNHLRLITVPM